MYSVFLDGWQFPITPSKLNVSIKGKNKTLTLVNDGEINFLKTPGLTEVKNFDAVFPMLSAYPFSVYQNGFKPPEWYLNKLEGIMLAKKPVQFVVSRVSPAGKLLFSTNLQVSLEDYEIKESATDGLDVTVSITLKQYKAFSTKIVAVTIAQAKPTPRSTSASSGGSGNKSYTPKVGDTVNFTGTRHYVASTSDKGYSCKPGKAKVTIIASGTKHPYHLIKVAGGGSTVYGWVNASDIEGVGSSTTKTASVSNTRAATSAPAAKTYTVKKGDSLWAITKRYTGNGARYNELYNANRSIIKNPNLIYPGQVLTLPW